MSLTPKEWSDCLDAVWANIKADEKQFMEDHAKKCPQDPHLVELWKQHKAKEPDTLGEIQTEAHESTLDAVFQFDLMTRLGYKLNFLTGEFE